MANALLADILPADKMVQVPAGAVSVTAKLLYMKTAAKVILHEILRPLAGGIVDDYSAPSDLNIALEPYGTNLSVDGDTASITFLSGLKQFVSEMFRLSINIFKAFIQSFKDLFTV